MVAIAVELQEQLSRRGQPDTLTIFLTCFHAQFLKHYPFCFVFLLCYQVQVFQSVI
jgi:hypothetical protein